MEAATVALGEVRIDARALAEICRRYGVRTLSLFGSAARAEMRHDSDVDLLVEFGPDSPIGLFEFESLAEDLTGLIGRRVDLGTKLKPWVRETVARDLRVVYEE